MKSIKTSLQLGKEDVDLGSVSKISHIICITSHSNSRGFNLKCWDTGPLLNSSFLQLFRWVPRPQIWRYPPNQQMSVTLPQKRIVQAQNYSDLVWLTLTLYKCNCQVWVLSEELEKYWGEHRNPFALNLTKLIVVRYWLGGRCQTVPLVFWKIGKWQTRNVKLTQGRSKMYAIPLHHLTSPGLIHPAHFSCEGISPWMSQFRPSRIPWSPAPNSIAMQFLNNLLWEMEHVQWCFWRFGAGEILNSYAADHSMMEARICLLRQCLRMPKVTSSFRGPLLGTALGNYSPVFYFIFILVMCHGWRSSQNTFSLSDDDSTEDLALMAKRLERTVKTVKNWQKNCPKQLKFVENYIVTVCNLSA